MRAEFCGGGTPVKRTPHFRTTRQVKRNRRRKSDLRRVQRTKCQGIVVGLVSGRGTERENPRLFQGQETFE